MPDWLVGWWRPVLYAVVVVICAMLVAASVGAGGGTFADDMNHACANHNGVFSMNAQQRGGVCRDGTAVAP